MKKNEKGFSAGIVLLLLVVIGLVGLAGWYIWQNQKSDSATKDTAKVATTSNAQQTSEPLSLMESKLPAGWTSEPEIKEAGRILVRNNNTNCFTDVIYGTDTAESNSPDVDQNKQTVDAIKSKGYSVEETKGKLTIVASSGEKQIDAQVLKVSGLDNPAFQNYAYITKSDSYTRIQLSCPSEADIQTAQTALKAIVLNKQ